MTLEGLSAARPRHSAFRVPRRRVKNA